MKTLPRLFAASEAVLILSACAIQPESTPPAMLDAGAAGASGSAGKTGLDGGEWPEGSSCTPKTCAQLDVSCGTVSDACLGTVYCGECSPGQACGGSGPNRCGTAGCSPKSCAQVGATCGVVSDGCSDVLDCGTCPDGETCDSVGGTTRCIADGGTAADGGLDAPAEAEADATTEASTFVVGSPPGAVSRWLVEHTDPAVVVRPDFFGLHVERNTGWPSYQAVPLPTFDYGLTRSHDHNGATSALEVDLQWARIEKSPGQFDWSGVDAWISDTVGKTRVFTLFGTPTFYQKYPDEAWRYPYLPGGGSPPAEMSKVAEFVTQLLNHRPGEIHYIEVWSAPNFYYAPDTSVTRWDSAVTSAEGGNTPFFSGTPQDLAQMARAIRNVLPSGVFLMAGGWEGQQASSTVNSMGRFSLASDGAGGTGRSTVQAFSFHHAFYNNDPNSLLGAIDGYRERLSEYGYPPTIEFHCSEIGHAEPTPATSLSDADVIRNIKRATYLAAAMRVATVAWYRYSSETALKAPYTNASVRAGLAVAAAVAGRTIRQAAVLQNGSVWLRLSTNDDLLE